jgi:gluconokinase
MYIGVDIGTSSVKAVSIDNKGVTRNIQQIPYSIFSSSPDFQEQDPEEIFYATVKVLKDILADNEDNRHQIKAISFSAAMHSLVAIDTTGKPLTQLITWADSRAKQIADNLRETDLGKQIYRQTGTAIHAMSPLCKLLWFKEHQPNLIAEAYKFIGIKEYVFFKLFGEYVIDFSLASATGLFDVFHLKWYKDSLQLIGIEENKLSTPVATTAIFQTKKFPEFANLNFIIGASDGCLANLGAGAVEEGQIATTIGTSGAIRMTSSQAFADEQMRTFCYYTVDNQYVIGGAVNNGGIILQWLRETFSPNETVENIFQSAKNISAGSEGLVFLPYLLGERAPIWDSSAKGVFFGIGKNHTQSHFYRAVLEGIMFALYSVGKVFKEIQSAQKEPCIYATGGFTKSDFWVQMMADIFNQKILVPNSSESTAIGACILAMKALGEINEWEEAQKMIPIEKEFLPDEANHTVYMKNFSVFEKLYLALKPFFHHNN